MASVLLPLAAAFGVSIAAGLAIGRRAVLVPLGFGVGFGLLLALNGAGDTAVGFIILWLLAAVAIGVWGALVGARMRDRR